jgi:hypothetical protein
MIFLGSLHGRGTMQKTLTLHRALGLLLALALLGGLTAFVETRSVAGCDSGSRFTKHCFMFGVRADP